MDPPPEVMATWPKPNYINPQCQGPQLRIFSVILLALSVTMVGSRLWVRIHIKRSAGWDDWIMICALPFLITITVLVNRGTDYGWGYHLWDYKIEWQKPSMMLNFICQVLFTTIMTLVKLSILLSYLRFLTVPLFRYMNWTMIALVLAWGSGMLSYTYFIALFLACSPLEAYWDIGAFQTATCDNEQSRSLSFTITNLITDILIVLIPIRTFWMLKLPTREKLLLTGLMSLGLLACIASAIRIYYAYRMFYGSYDVSWEVYQVWFWILVEINLAVICASMPTLRPLTQRYFPKLGFKSSNILIASNRNHNRIHMAIPQFLTP
ncbi:hypothetical protein P175DRAFT_0508898 [Aspergillus ochraceoroseus IBT 24754]|uniref:Rhodopsin domain-containing protein n=1 Tax=Aspergillus ochraceoroseus IBT 24754 TaxID=1392256 RepID=A0A2T5M0F8_9EURO|nr:uncharacterized protein P175DRAFT_0508898 [Aspergillus ochraceoroseus IBT 24754]PTU22020.1 hypothetical protein P175DRAFT_0508898 [Aspergillus ochraceoroseus IBT 24754]